METEGLIKIREISLKGLPKLHKTLIALLGISLALNTLTVGEIFGIEPIKSYLSLLLIFTIIPVVILHELAHGIIYKIYTGVVKFGFEFKSGLGPTFYATSPGYILPRSKFIVAALAPQFITAAVILLASLTQNTNNWVSNSLLMFAAMNLGGGCVDLYFTVLLLRLKENVFVEDTRVGAIIYRKYG